MARPKKLTLDFIIHDVHTRSDIKIRRLCNRHKSEGYTTFFCLLEEMCKNDGMRLELSDVGVAEVLAQDFFLRDTQHLLLIIQDCIEIGLFDRQLWESERIVFSHGLYSRYLKRLEDREQAAKRKNRQNEASGLAKRIQEVKEKDITRSSEVITRENQGFSRDIPPDIQNYRTTELQNQISESELNHFVNSEAESTGEVPPVQDEKEEDPEAADGDRPSAQAIKLEWIKTVFLPNYPYRMQEGGGKVRNIGAIANNPANYAKFITVGAIESGQATQALRSMIATQRDEYRKHFGSEPEKIVPRGSSQWVYALRFVPDPVKWLKERRWGNESMEGTNIPRPAAPENKPIFPVFEPPQANPDPLSQEETLRAIARAKSLLRGKNAS